MIPFGVRVRIYTLGDVSYVVPSETPQSLFDFFSSLAAGGAENEEKCELHYGCECVIRRALTASQMLLDVQKTLGVQKIMDANHTGDVTDGDGSANPETQNNAEREAREAKIVELMDGQRQALEEAEHESDRLLVQNMELTKNNEGLNEKLIILHKQIDRMYAKTEMSTLLDKLESGESEPKPAHSSENEPDAEQQASAAQSSADEPPVAAPEALPEATTEPVAENAEDSESPEPEAEPDPSAQPAAES